MAKTREPAPYAPVARVLPLLGLSQLDRIFEYRIDAEQSEDCQPGVMVRVRFAHRLVNAVVIDRVSDPDHPGQLKWLERVISPEVVYTEKLRALIAALAARYGGITSDLIRAAIPSRHAAAETSDTTTAWEDCGEVSEPDLSAFAKYSHGTSFVDAVLAQKIARAAWQFAPQEDWALAMANLAVKVALEGRGALIVVPHQRDVDRLEKALRTLVGTKQITILTSSLGKQARYRRFLSVLHGQGRLVIGTRSAAFAPVNKLSLIILKDDGDENLVDPRAPYIHAREVLTTRSAQEKASLILAGWTRTAESQLLVESGWVHDLSAPREVIRRSMPRIHASADTDLALERDRYARNSRLPSSAFQAIRSSLEKGLPALVQVPRKGYIPVLSCGNCRHPARCRGCNGPLGISNSRMHPRALTPSDRHHPVAAAVPECKWCGRQEPNYRCMECGKQQLRAVVLGQERTAEEFGLAFPQTPIRTSGGKNILATVVDKPAIVIATPGAEPTVDGLGYGAAVLLDTWSLLGRQDLRATEEAFKSWMSASSLVIPGRHGGEVVIVADPGLAVVQHLIRWDAPGHAARELAERSEVNLPPAVHMAAIDGAAGAVEQFLRIVELPPSAVVLGPVDLPPGQSLPGEYDQDSFGPPQRILIRAPLFPKDELGRALSKAAYARALKKQTLPLRIQVDPLRIG
ncbi:primosomal protein N' [Corynebacterium sp. ES2794-CONJ1]|uniref:primosomal protein N' n=1 Tax=Corynebacterium sp. ES2794-CONJ1 TaxID=2980553 RepID=UPI0021D82DBC|nr:primosomal protein N' [Corynebacterium sp. ES2794-CONJ1]MCU9518399.1 primosomal protein N' [Corynebacterium sp. ES2794-CONJ1]